MTAAAAKRWFQPLVEATKKRSLLHRVREYRGFVDICYETQEFKVSTAMTGHRLLKALELRHEVFIEEWQGRRAWHRMDVDDYDFAADHLLIEHKATGEVVGTYRLLSSHFTSDFYTSSEFDLTHFLRVPSVKLEMGRACIQAAYRNGATIDILWKGLSQYVEATKTQFLFGCSSIKALDPRQISRLYRTLAEQGAWCDEYLARPTEDYVLGGFSRLNVDPLSPAEKRELMPPLLRSYIQAGAMVHGLPAADLDFGCTDLLTILDWSKLNPRFQSRFVTSDKGR